jgi:predicted glycosyltransferase involved in capsule biosynthesis
MSKKYSLSYIIGYRHKADRLINLRKTIDWLRCFSNIEIIIVEQDRWSKIDHLSLPVKLINIKSDSSYNRSWGFNVGLKYAQSDIIAFGDSDLIMNQDDFINAINELKNYEMISPYNSVIDLTAQESGLSYKDIISINRPGRGQNDNQLINICGGISLFTRQAIEKIGGWSEEFFGWGGEDDYQTIKVKNMLTWKELGANCFHFWHQRDAINPGEYQKTLEILQKAKSLSREDLQRSIDVSRRRIGMKNKMNKI